MHTPGAPDRWNRARLRLAQLAAVAIICGAIALTYAGTTAFCHAHGAPGWRGGVIAGMNDAAVLVGIVWPARALRMLAGLCAGFTVWANFAHATPGAAGVSVALLPPVLAFLMVYAYEDAVRSERDMSRDTSRDIEGDTAGTSEGTGPGTFGETFGGQDTGHSGDMSRDIEGDSGGDIGGDTGRDNVRDIHGTQARDIPQVTALTGRTRKVVEKYVAGDIDRATAARQLGVNTRTISRHAATLRAGSGGTEAVG